MTPRELVVELIKKYTDRTVVVVSESTSHSGAYVYDQQKRNEIGYVFIGPDNRLIVACSSSPLTTLPKFVDLMTTTKSELHDLFKSMFPRYFKEDRP
jgi:hypothetical protein